MKTNKLLIYSSIAAFVFAVGLFVYLVNTAKALSYLSSDPKKCVNCHVMNTQYSTWQHSSHAQRATCVDCHLPSGSFFSKYSAKARDGWKHSVAFTFSTFSQSIKISENAADRVQENCIACHSKLTETMKQNAGMFAKDTENALLTGRRCWDCHREVPHGKLRSLTSTPYSLGVRELK